MEIYVYLETGFLLTALVVTFPLKSMTLHYCESKNSIIL